MQASRHPGEGRVPRTASDADCLRCGRRLGALTSIPQHTLSCCFPFLTLYRAMLEI